MTDRPNALDKLTPNSLFVERSEVRGIVLRSDIIDHVVTALLLKEVDALPIFTAEDLAALRTPRVEDAREAPAPYEAPFVVHYSGIQDARGRYVAELSNPYGTIVRDAMVRFIVDALNSAQAMK